MDAEAWDTCVKASPYAIAYAQAWYLDCVAPGDWYGLVLQRTGSGDTSYRAVMPVFISNRLGLTYGYRPFFCQQAGLFSSALLSNAEVEAFITALLNAAPAGSYAFREHFGLPAFAKGVQVTSKITHLLLLAKPYSQIAEGYDSNTKRILKKTDAVKIHCRVSTEIESLIKIFKENRGAQLPEVKEKHYANIARLAEYALRNGQGFILKVLPQSDISAVTAYAAALFITFGGRTIYLFGAATEAGKENGSMRFLFDSVIRDLAADGKRLLIPPHTQSHILDFEGGSDEGTGRFYRSLGALPAEYPVISYNRYPWPLKLLF